MVKLDSENAKQIKGATTQGELSHLLAQESHHHRWVVRVKLLPCTQQEPFASVCEGSAG